MADDSSRAERDIPMSSDDLMEQKLTSIFRVPGYTFFDWGFNVRTYKDPDEAVEDEYVKFFKLLDGDSQSAELKLKIGNKTYPANIRLSKHSAGKTENSGPWKAMHRIRFEWKSKHETKKALRNLFIYAYVTTIDKSNPPLKELVEFVHMGGSEFKVKAIGKQVTEFDDMFRFMEDKNLFEFWRDRNKKNEKRILLDKPNPIWRSGIEQFNKARKRSNVIYLLYHSKKNEFYVGKANVFGGRVTKYGKAHQGISEGWDRFMLFDLDPDFVSLYKIEEIEDFAIRLFSTILENNLKVKNIKGKPILVNKAPLKK